MDTRERNADEVLKMIKKRESRRGKLRVFFGFAAGVGKTYAMLAEAHELMLMGKNVVIGYIEPHDRPDTNRLIEGLPQISPKQFHYKQLELYEPDIDRLLALAPDIVLIDELAHTNAQGSRNKKRYQDVEELLNAGINVMTTMNVQHLESLNDIVEEITGVEVRETVPDTFFNHAALKVVDVEPDELIDRLRKGKIYSDENARRALKKFFVTDKLDQLRGLAIQKTSDHINKVSAKTFGIQTKLLTIIDDSLPRMGEKCVRWTSRLAQSVGADWIVMQIRADSSVGKNTELAEKLGAEVVVIEAEDSFETIVEYAKMTGITDIVMGKNLSRKWYQGLFSEPLEDRLLKRLKETEIHLIPYQEKEKVQWWLPTKNFFEGGAKDFFIVVGGMVAATIITEAMQYLHFGEQNLMLIYIFFVLLIARLTSGYFWSGLSSILSVLSFNWFFVEPLYSLTVYKSGYPITLIIMFLVALMVSNLMVRLKTKAVASMEKEHQLEILYELNKQYMLASGNDQLFEITSTYLSRLLDREVLLYDASGVQMSGSKPANAVSVLEGNKEEAAVAFWVSKNQKEAGSGTDTLSGAKGLYLPIVFEGKSLGVLGLEQNSFKAIENNQLNYLYLVTAQLAIVLGQSSLKEEKELMQIENERERVRSNLLRAVSHDLRTPLTAISGIAEALEDDQKDSMLDSETKAKLLTDIREEAQWLVRMVENLLSVTRINMDTMEVKKTVESLEEVVGSVLKHLKKVYPDRKINVMLPEEITFIHVDPFLIEQALFNLIENAYRHGERNTPVSLAVRKNDEKSVFEIINKGKIPEAQFSKIQNNLSGEDEIPVDSKNGLGIGLSIVKTIIHAHGGVLEMDVKEDQTVFHFELE